MKHMRSGDWIKTGLVALLLGRLAPRRTLKWALAVLLSVDLIGVASALHAKSNTVTATLVLQVSEASLVEQQNDNVIIKLRLARGVAVNLWGGKSCTATGDESQIITASGSYTIPLSQIFPRQKADGDEQGFICLQSSDGALRRSLPIIRRASFLESSAEPAKSSPGTTWAGHVSIGAAPVPSASRARQRESNPTK